MSYFFLFSEKFPFFPIFSYSSPKFLFFLFLAFFFFDFHTIFSQKLKKASEIRRISCLGKSHSYEIASCGLSRQNDHMISRHVSFTSEQNARTFVHDSLCIQVCMLRVFPYLRKEVVADVNKSYLPFSMHFDETTTAQVKKQMDLTLSYWSPTHNEVIVTFYAYILYSVFWTC